MSPFLAALVSLSVHWNWQPFLFFLLELGEGPHGLFIGHSRDHSVRRLIVKLNEMEMGVDFGRLEVCDIIIVPLAGQKPIDAIINIGPNNEGIFLVIVRASFSFFFMDDIEQTMFIDNGRLTALGAGQLNWSLDEMNIVFLTGPARSGHKLHRPFSPGWAGYTVWIAFLIVLNGLEPRSTIMIFGERHPFAKMRSHPGPGDFAGLRLKPDTSAVLQLYTLAISADILGWPPDVASFSLMALLPSHAQSMTVASYAISWPFSSAVFPGCP